MTTRYAEDAKRRIKEAVADFTDHVALWSPVPGQKIEILDFRKPDSIEYALRIVFDNERGGRVYISGDIGEAVVYPTCAATLEDMARCFTRREPDGSLEVNEHYFLEKVRATSDKFVWSPEEFEKDFRDRCRECGADPDFVDEFMEERFGETFCGVWVGADGIHIDDTKGITIDDDIREVLENRVDRDCWEWFYDCGKRINPRVIMWLVAMRLAWEQVDAMIKAPKE